MGPDRLDGVASHETASPRAYGEGAGQFSLLGSRSRRSTYKTQQTRRGEVFIPLARSEGTDFRDGVERAAFLANTRGCRL